MLLLSLQPGLRTPLKAYFGAYIYFEIDEDVIQPFSEGCDLSISLWDCLADGSGDTDDGCQGHRKVLHTVMRETRAVIAC